MCEEMLLEDVWRDRNPDQFRFSWHERDSKGMLLASRIDYVLMSAGLCQMVEQTMYLPGILTDHSTFYIGIKLNKTCRGPGFWKFNTTYLKDSIFLEKTNAFLDHFLATRKQMEIVPKWELLKFEIGQMCREYSKEKASLRELLISQLSEKVVELEDKVADDNATDLDIDLLIRSKAYLDEQIKEKIKGVIFRSKSNWQDLGEKTNKYFFSLEKAKYKAKTCTVLLNEADELITDPQKILEAQQKFYEKLYKSDQAIHFNIKNECNISLSEQKAHKLDTPFTFEEFSIALKQMKNSKCPGLDGIPCDFWKVFFSKIGWLLFEVITYSLENNVLWDSALRGVINLIPKANKDTRRLKNLRPITLLNTDYKVIKKIMANCLKPVLEETIINMDQKGFLRGRRISANIRKILDLVDYANETDEDIMVLSVDFQKCFDMIEFEAIFKSMEFLGFGENMISWAKTLYTDFTVAIQNNGYFSNKIRIQRSVHQGGPCSTYFFLICAEILAILLRSNDKIKGITIDQIEYLLGQYADDMDSYLQNDPLVLKETIDTLEYFRANSGFTINYDKTALFGLGMHSDSQMGTEVRVGEGRTLKVSAEPINVLGVWIVQNADELYSLNYDPLIQKVSDMLNQWKNRNLTLYGKINVINTLCVSLFVYKMQVLPRIPNEVVKIVEKEFVRYIWKGGIPKIALKILQGNKPDGGMGLVDLRIKDKALKINWVVYLTEDIKVATLAYNALGCILREHVWTCNLNKEDLAKSKGAVFKKNNFWIDVLTAHGAS